MRTTLDIPDTVLKHTMSITRAHTKREAIITALEDFNRRHRMAALVAHLGTCQNLITPAELQSQRRDAEARK